METEKKIKRLEQGVDIAHEIASNTLFQCLALGDLLVAKSITTNGEIEEFIRGVHNRLWSEVALLRTLDGLSEDAKRFLGEMRGKNTKAT